MKCNPRKLSVSEKAALDREIKAQLADYIRTFEKQIDALVLYCEHKAHGHGRTKLRRTFDMFQLLLKDLQQHYEMNTEDQAFLCERELKKIGVDLDEWRREDAVFKGGIDE